MKYLLLTLTMLLCAGGYGFAKEGEVILTRFYTQAERKILPEKADQFQVQNLTLSTSADVKDLVAAISHIADVINDNDFEHYTFSLYVYRNSDNSSYSIQIEAHDPMNDPKQLRDNVMGVVKIGYRYYIVQKMPDMEALQKKLYAKAKGKTKFIREFELVDIPRKETRTFILADTNNGDLQYKELEICNENKMGNSNTESK